MKEYKACTVPGCNGIATHQQENLPDSAIFHTVIPGTFNYYCKTHAELFSALYAQAEQVRREWESVAQKERPPGRLAIAFGPVVEINLDNSNGVN